MTPSLALAERNVPRYTSYPTAPHFSDKVGAQTYADWLATLRPDTTLSLYLHVPYCKDICFYCGCATKAVRRREPVERYAEHLAGEIGLLRGRANGKVTQLHWGGGTPSILGIGRIASLTAQLDDAFGLGGLTEHAIELDPRETDRALVKTYAELKVTRASLGVQDFSPHVQEAIGRIQPFGMVERLTGELRDAGITAINFDLMYGLPHQTAADVARTAELAASLRPSRIALFGYAHVPWFRPHQRRIDEAALPGVLERLVQARAATETLAAHGYVAIGLDHFALPDDALAIAARERRMRRNFQGYTTDEAGALIGLGATAIGRLPQGYVQNAPDVGGYMRAIAAGQFAARRGLALSNDDRLRAAIIERLMCDMAADLDALAGDHRTFARELESLAPLAEAGLLTVDGGTVTMTNAGRPYLRLAAAAFDAYLPASQKRHSLAV